VRRADFASVLGLDPRLRGLGALLDLALRLHARGRLVAYQPQAGLVTQRNEAEPLSASDAVLLRRQWGVAAATSPDALWVDGRSPGPTAAPLAGAAGHFRDDPARRPPAHVDIGRHSFFGSGARFLTYTAEERIRIGKYCSFAADVTIFTGGGHSTDTVSTFPFENVLFGATNPTRSSRSTRDTVIGNDAWVGDRAVIAGGVHVGDGAVVGTAAVVLADVPPCAVVAGNPATVLRYRFSKGTVAALLRIAWWEWGDEELRDRLEWFFRPVGDFVRRFDVAGQGEESG
jgi:acetyltransferase-like isoleucine patch superfamily enzyme